MVRHDAHVLKPICRDDPIFVGGKQERGWLAVPTATACVPSFIVNELEFHDVLRSNDVVRLA